MSNIARIRTADEAWAGNCNGVYWREGRQWYFQGSISQNETDRVYITNDAGATRMTREYEGTGFKPRCQPVTSLTAIVNEETGDVDYGSPHPAVMNHITDEPTPDVDLSAVITTTTKRTLTEGSIDLGRGADIEVIAVDTEDRNLPIKIDVDEWWVGVPELRRLAVVANALADYLVKEGFDDED